MFKLVMTLRNLTGRGRRGGLLQGHEPKLKNLGTKKQKECQVRGKTQGIKAEKNT